MIKSNEDYFNQFKETKSKQVEEINKLLNNLKDKYTLCKKLISDVDLEKETYTNNINHKLKYKSKLENEKNEALEYYENEMIKISQAVKMYMALMEKNF